MRRGSSRPPRRSAIAELTLPADPERALSLAYAPHSARPALSALWRLDEQLGAAIARTDNPAVAQMRLTWWYEALSKLGEASVVDPLLVELAGLPDLDPRALLPLIDGWEALLEPFPLSDDALLLHARQRGAALFLIAGQLLGDRRQLLGEAGRLWALTDLAYRISDPATAQRALALAPEVSGRWPRPLAPLVALARRDRRSGRAHRRQGSPSRVIRAMVAGLTGY